MNKKKTCINNHGLAWNRDLTCHTMNLTGISCGYLEENLQGRRTRTPECREKQKSSSRETRLRFRFGVVINPRRARPKCRRKNDGPFSSDGLLSILSPQMAILSSDLGRDRSHYSDSDREVAASPAEFWSFSILDQAYFARLHLHPSSV